jgi:FkbM family methyltransferase
MTVWWWRGIKLWAVVRAYFFARRKLRGVRPVLFDIGARNGLQQKWNMLARAGVIDAVLFEPDQDEAARLREQRTPARIVEKAVGEGQRAATLHVYRNPGLSSVREVNPALLTAYQYGNSFDEVGRVPVMLHPLADVIGAGEAPRPQFLKIDVQGFELEVLRGLGAMLDEVVAVELESQFVEMYLGQATFPTLYAWMLERGFGLVALRPSWIHGHNLFEVDAYFSRNPASLREDQRTLREFWHRLNRISSAQLVAIRGH